MEVAGIIPKGIDPMNLDENWARNNISSWFGKSNFEDKVDPEMLSELKKKL